MSRILQDIRYAARKLRKSPGFTAVAVLTLGIGIGANTAVYSVVNGVMLRPIPYEQPDRVVSVWNSFVEWERVWLSEPEFVDYRETIDSFEQLAAYNPIDVNLTGGAEPERVAAAAVTVNLFDALGVEAVIGRTFTADERQPGRDDVVILGHGLWQRRFGGDPAIVGRTVPVHDRPHTVVGVAPASFKLPQDFETEERTQLWVPLGLDPNDLDRRGHHYLHVIARLAPGATVAEANTELDMLSQRWVAEGITDIEGFTTFAEPVKEDVVGTVRPALLILLGAVGFVLLIACANVANLLFVRADGRQREIALRVALGSGRGRIVSQLLAESVLLAAVGGALGLLFAYAGVEALVALDPASVPRLDRIGLDSRVLAFTGGLAALTGIVFGIMPALQASRLDLTTPLKGSARGGGFDRRHTRFRRTLVVAEVAVSVVLVIGAGLMIRSFQQLRGIELGLDPQNVLSMRLSLPGTEYGTAEMITFYRQLGQRVEALRTVSSAGAAALIPLASTIGDWGIDIEGRTEAAGENYIGYLQVVTPGYFEAMGIARVRGRPIRASDRMDGRPVIVINEAMAERYWPGEPTIGKRFRLSGFEPAWFTVVGVVANVRHNAVSDDPRPVMYFPHAQLPLALGGTTAAMALVVETAGDPLTSLGPVRETIRAMDPDLPIAEVRTMDGIVSAAFSQTRFIMLLLAVFAGLALTLGAVGMYGMVAYAVSRRTREMGIRMALGAGARDVRRFVLRQGAGLAGIGVAVGLAASFAASRVLSGMLFGVSATDPLTFAAVAVLLGAVALLASYIPARRATKVDPMTALREE